MRGEALMVERRLVGQYGKCTHAGMVALFRRAAVLAVGENERHVLLAIRLDTPGSARPFPIETLRIDRDQRIFNLPLGAEFIDCLSAISPGILAVIVDDDVSADRKAIVQRVESISGRL